MKLSVLGKEMLELSGIRSIMGDMRQLSELRGTDDWINLGLGAPSTIGDIEEMWLKHAQKQLREGFALSACRYGDSRGYPLLLEALVEHFNHQYGWNITQKNILITPGSQAIAFIAFSVFAGKMDDGSRKKVILPSCPDYTGYEAAILNKQDLFGCMSDIELFDERHFKYVLNLGDLPEADAAGLMMLSRPANPTSGVLSDRDMADVLAKSQALDIPMFVDCAYAAPFPNMVFSDVHPIFDEHIVNCFSFSKAGLPGERVGVAIGHSRYIDAMSAFLANSSLHSSRFGQAIVASAISSGDLAYLCGKTLPEFYRQKANKVLDMIHQLMPNVNWKIHLIEGGMFAWIFIDEDKFSDLEFYEALKKQGVFVIPGRCFFPPNIKGNSHAHKCFRLSFSGSLEDINAGLKIIALVLSIYLV